MFTPLITTLMRWLGLKGSELLFIGITILAIITVWFVYQQKMTLEREVGITEDALRSVLDINQALNAQKTIDMAVVTTWMETREQYRQQQTALVDTTFLDYFNVAPEPIELPDLVVVAQSPSVPATSPSPPEIVHVNETPAGMSDAQLRTLATGLRDVYCRAQYTDPLECPP